MLNEAVVIPVTANSRRRNSLVHRKTFQSGWPVKQGSKKSLQRMRISAILRIHKF